MFASWAESCCCNSWLCSLALASTPWETICFILPSRKVGLLSASHLPQMFKYFFPTSPHGWHVQSLSHMRVPCLAPEPGNQHLPCWSSLTAGSFETSSNILYLKLCKLKWAQCIWTLLGSSWTAGLILLTYSALCRAWNCRRRWSCCLPMRDSWENFWGSLIKVTSKFDFPFI